MSQIISDILNILVEVRGAIYYFLMTLEGM